MKKPRKFELRFKEIDGVLYKICTKCKEFKILETEFTKAKNTTDQRTPSCNECRRKITQDPVKVRQRYKEVGVEKKQQYYQKNKPRIHAQRKNKLQTDKESNLLRRVRTFVRKHRLNNKDKVNSRTKQILGCTKPELFLYLKLQFVETYGIPYNDIYFKDLHIDHKIPMSKGKTEEEFIKLNHYTNLQFLHKDHNMQKKAKLNYVIPRFPIENYKEVSDESIS